MSIVIERGDDVQKISYRPEDSYQNLIEHFYEAVIKKEIAIYPLAGSLKNMIVIDAIFQSAIEDGKLIALK